MRFVGGPPSAGMRNTGTIPPYLTKRKLNGHLTVGPKTASGNRAADLGVMVHFAGDGEGICADSQQVWAPWQAWRAASAECSDWRVTGVSDQKVFCSS